MRATTEARATDRRAVHGRPRRSARRGARRAGRRTCGIVHADIRVVGVDRPIDAATPQTVFGADKYELLSSAKLLLNIHRDRPATAASDDAHPPYFEWARAVEAMANGCVVISEPSEGCKPLVAGDTLRRGTGRRDGRRRSPTCWTIDDVATQSPSRRWRSLRRAGAGQLTRHRFSIGSRRTCCSTSPPIRTLRWPARARGDLASARVLTRCGLARSARTCRPLSPPSDWRWPRTRALQRLDAVACELQHGSRQHITRYRDPGIRRRNAGSECRGLAVQLRGRRRRDVDQHRRQRGHRLRTDRRRGPRHRRQPRRRAAIHRRPPDGADRPCSPRTPTRVSPRRATPASSTPARHW